MSMEEDYSDLIPWDQSDLHSTEYPDLRDATPSEPSVIKRGSGYEALAIVPKGTVHFVFTGMGIFLYACFIVHKLHQTRIPVHASMLIISLMRL